MPAFSRNLWLLLGAPALPIVAETWDGSLNDIDGFHVRKEHAFAAMDSARGGAVPEGLHGEPAGLAGGGAARSLAAILVVGRPERRAWSDLRRLSARVRPDDDGLPRRWVRIDREPQVRAVAEQYPELRATENFQQLSRNLSELEDEIQASRRIYNSNVQAYNTKIQIFPNSVVANSGGFTAREFFEITDAAEREPVQVSF